MAETFPATPAPAMVSSPEVMDPMWQMGVESGYSIRRARWSRPRRRYRLEYLGQSVAYVRLIRDFFQRQRLGVLDFMWFHPTAVDVAQVLATTPVQLQYQHGLVTGQWVGVSNS